ncbi:MAG: DUF1659 domain-containing protein [Selenomonadaceae bacterium]|nr:DUF1659 domain-containing protein [Selenomonadaceae bacterium]MBR3722263.1 DUF1659 domain-containing protein [Selenomonadaceae bacterium]
MATRNEESTKLAVRVEVGSGDDVSYKNRTFNHIAPNTTDDNVLSFGNRLGALQSHTVNAIVRTDVATLVAD